MKGVMFKSIFLVLLTCIMTTSAAAENVLRWASQGDPLSYDPHSVSESTTIGASYQVYEPLVNRNSDLELEPSLAVSWEIINPTTWQFNLRKGVTFHDGTPFTAEDVAFSVKRANGETSEFRNYIKSVIDTKVLDDYTIQLITSGPDPILPSELAAVFMMSKKWCEKHDVTEATTFKDKGETYAVRHENGTGPFILELREPGIKTILVKNTNWWGLEQDPHNIDRIIYTPITNAATRIAALLSGEVDFLLDPPLQDLNRIKNTPNLKIQQTAQIRTIFYGLDQGSDELRSSDIKGKNPFKDPRVRKAIHLAINIEAIQKKVMRGMSIPANVITPPGVHGYPKALDEQRPSYDPEKAKKLLAEAGYPDGFKVSLDCPNNRYMNDEKICQATVGMLGKIGIDVELVAQPKTLHFPKITGRTSDFYMLGWGVPSLDSLFVFSYLIDSKGPWNGSNYSNPHIDGLLKSIESEMDLTKRDEMISEVWTTITEEQVYVPLHHQVIVWAMDKKLEMPMEANDQPQFRWARLKELK
jgi:peptide/nickel transport system substrate-binding protein